MSLRSIRSLLVSSQLLLLALCHVPAFASNAEGSLLWQERLDVADGFDNANASVLTNHELVVAGAIVNAAGNTDWAVRAYDRKTGALLWQDVLDRAARTDTAVGIVADRGFVFVSGYVTSATGNRDVLLRAYDERTGKVRWESQYDQAGRTDQPDFNNLAVDGGRVVVGGKAANAAGASDWFVRAYDERTGKFLWQDLFDGGNFDHNVALVMDNGRVYASGVTTDAAFMRHFTVRTYDAATGAVLWQEQIANGNFGSFFVTDVAWRIVAQGKRVVAVGSIGDGNDNFSLAVRAYQAESGTLLWSDLVNSGAGSDVAWDAALGDNTVYVAGGGGAHCSSFESSNCNWLIRAYDLKNGKLRWKKEVDHAGGDDQPNVMIATKDRVIVAGSDESGFEQGTFDWVVRAFSADNGAKVWEDVIKAPDGEGYPLDISAGGGRVFVNGWILDDAGNGDWVVRAHQLKGHCFDDDED